MYVPPYIKFNAREIIRFCEESKHRCDFEFGYTQSKFWDFFYSHGGIFNEITWGLMVKTDFVNVSIRSPRMYRCTCTIGTAMEQ